MQNKASGGSTSQKEFTLLLLCTTTASMHFSTIWHYPLIIANVIKLPLNRIYMNTLHKTFNNSINVI